MSGPACDRCQSSNSFVAAGDRICGFGAGGVFRSRNRHCLTLAALVGLSEDKATSTDGLLHLRSVGGHSCVVLLAWRGNGATVELAQVVRGAGDGLVVVPLTLESAEETILWRSSLASRSQ